MKPTRKVLGDLLVESLWYFQWVQKKKKKPSKSIGNSGFLSAQSLMNGFLSVQSIRNGTNNKNNKVATFISNSKTVNRAPPYIPDRRLKNLKR